MKSPRTPLNPSEPKVKSRVARATSQGKTPGLDADAENNPDNDAAADTGTDILDAPLTSHVVADEPATDEAPAVDAQASDDESLDIPETFQAPPVRGASRWMTRTPTVETPRLELPRTQVFSPEPPKVETPKIEIPKIETPKVEAPQADAPHAEPLRWTPPPQSTPPETVAAEKPAAAPEPAKAREVIRVTTRTEAPLERSGRGIWIWGSAAFVCVLWAAGMAAFAFGAQGDLTAFVYKPFRLVLMALFALFPVGMVMASAFLLRNAAALARQAQRTAALADALVAPAASAAQQTGALVETLREQVDHAVRAVRLAHADVTELSDRLKTETDRLHDAAQIARSATQSVTHSLQHEREALSILSASLNAQSNEIIAATDRQARMVADASDLAQTQLREAEASLTASAASMTNAAADVSDAARTASEDLDRQTVRLETTGAGVTDQIRTVEDSLSQQRAGLVSASLSLRADQEDFAVHIENQRAQLTEALSITRVATVDLGETSARGIDVLRDIVVAAQEHFRAVGGAAENERTAFETRIQATLSNISMMAADARDDLIEETRRSLEQLNTAAADSKRAADQAAQTAQMRVDRLNETIFEASKKADEVFDSRFAAARRLIEDSAGLIGEAGDQTAQKLDESFAQTRQSLVEVQAALDEMKRGADQMPEIAQERVADIRRSVEEGIAAMMAAARTAAQETEAIDTAFQERIKRNYDMLNEAVRLMGVISGEQPLPTTASAPAPARDRDYGRVAQRPAETPAPPAQRTATPPAAATPAVPNGRLRLSPLGAETRPSPGPAATPQPQARPAAQPRPQSAPQTAQPPAQSVPAKTRQDAWSWRDLLNGMEGRDNAPAVTQPPVQAPQAKAPVAPPQDAEFDNIDEVMVAEINAMGVDATALLSRARIDETVAAIVAEDNEGARMVVRRVAPAAIRRLSRRLLSDAALRQQVNDFVTYYDQQINIALMSKNVSGGLTDLFSNDAGRAYLLLDAAISDL